MIQLVTLILFLVSMIGIAFILFTKIPTLVQLPKNGPHGFKKNASIVKMEKKIKHFYFHFFEKQMLLQTLLSKSRIWILKIERKIDELLHGIRKKAQELDREGKKK